jgi:hypothetical protein
VVLLPEWLEYHLLIGVEHFYIFDHQTSDDGSRELLQRYVDRGVVSLHEWTTPFIDVMVTYNRALDLARGQAKWLALLDSDEFLTLVEPGWDVGTYMTVHYTRDDLPSPTDIPGAELLHAAREEALIMSTDGGIDLAAIGSVSVEWLMFGTGHVARVPEDRLMIEMLTRCASKHPKPNSNRYSKSIVRPERVERMAVQEAAVLKPGYTRVAAGRNYALMQEEKLVPVMDVSRMRLNHYWTRDEWFLENVKIPRRIALTGDGREWAMSEAATFDEMDDYVILRYVPEVRRRLGLKPNGVTQLHPTPIATTSGESKQTAV